MVGFKKSILIDCKEFLGSITHNSEIQFLGSLDIPNHSIQITRNWQYSLFNLLFFGDLFRQEYERNILGTVHIIEDIFRIDVLVNKQVFVVFRRVSK